MKYTHHFYVAKIFIPLFIISSGILIYFLGYSWYWCFLAIPLGYIIYLALYSIIFIMCMIVYIFFYKKVSLRFIHSFPKGTMRDICFFLRIKVKVFGKENIPKDNKFAIVANHQSMADILVIMNEIDAPIAFVAKKELSKIPILSFFMKRVGCEFIDRNDIKQSLRAINNATSKVAAGNPMLIFPEGTRAKDGVIKNFKAGSLRVATKAEAPILPVSIKDTYKVRKKFPFKRSKVKLTIHKPITFEQYSVMDKNELSTYIRDIVKRGIE